MRRRNRPLSPIGGRLSRFTTDWCEFSLRRLSISTVPWPLAMRDGPEAGLAHIEAVLEHGGLANYYLAHSAHADMYRRLGGTAEARASSEKTLTQQGPGRQFLKERIRQLK